MNASPTRGSLWKRLPICFRLTAWHVASLSALITLFGILIDGLMHDRLLSRTDSELEEELHELQLETEIASDRNELARQLELRFGHHATFDFIVQTPASELVFASGRIGNVSEAVPVTRAGSVPPYSNAKLEGLGECRIGVREVSTPNGPFSIAVAAPLGRYLTELNDLRLLLATIGPLIVTISIAGGWCLARKSLRPVDAMIATADRITAERREERLIAPNPHDELGRLASTLNAMLDRLQHSLDETRQFTADAAHELRTPLAVIRSTAEIALRGSRSAAQYADSLQTVLEETERLTQLANQLLILAREEAGLHQEPHELIDLAEITTQAANDLEPLAAIRGVTLNQEVTQTAPVRADRDRIRRVLVNLLDNAIKYTPAGGQVRIDVDLHENVAEVIVRDTGIGIPAEHVDRVFDRFYRVDSSHSHETGGTGLGLAICRAIIASHRGRIALSSQPDVGTEISVTLPAVTS